MWNITIMIVKILRLQTRVLETVVGILEKQLKLPLADKTKLKVRMFELDQGMSALDKEVPDGQ